MPGPPQPWDQPEDPRDQTVDMPRIDLAGFGNGHPAPENGARSSWHLGDQSRTLPPQAGLPPPPVGRPPSADLPSDRTLPAPDRTAPDRTAPDRSPPRRLPRRDSGIHPGQAARPTTPPPYEAPLPPEPLPRRRPDTSRDPYAGRDPYARSAGDDREPGSLFRPAPPADGDRRAARDSGALEADARDGLGRDSSAAAGLGRDSAAHPAISSRLPNLRPAPDDRTRPVPRRPAWTRGSVWLVSSAANPQPARRCQRAVHFRRARLSWPARRLLPIQPGRPARYRPAQYRPAPCRRASCRQLSLLSRPSQLTRRCSRSAPHRPATGQRTPRRRYLANHPRARPRRPAWMRPQGPRSARRRGTSYRRSCHPRRRRTSPPIGRRPRMAPGIRPRRPGGGPDARSLAAGRRQARSAICSRGSTACRTGTRPRPTRTAAWPSHCRTDSVSSNSGCPRPSASRSSPGCWPISAVPRSSAPARSSLASPARPTTRVRRLQPPTRTHGAGLDSAFGPES